MVLYLSVFLSKELLLKKSADCWQMKVNNKKEIRSVTLMPNKRKNLTAIGFPSLASLTLAACGGGGGGGPIVQPPPANRAPVAEADKTLQHG